MKKIQSPISKVIISDHVLRILKEAALWMFGALSLILWISLFTYDVSDPGFTQVSTSNEINNAIGKIGALVSDLLFYIFGLPAYLFTVLVLYSGWVIFKSSKKQEKAPNADLMLRLFGFFIILLTSCALATLHFSPDDFRETAGGIIGQVIGGSLNSSMKLLGATTLLFFFMVSINIPFFRRIMD